MDSKKALIILDLKLKLLFAQYFNKKALKSMKLYSAKHK